MTIHRLAILSCCAIYYLLLNWSYFAVESVMFSYIGLQYAPPSNAYQLLGFAMALVPALWLPTALVRPSAVCQWMLYIMLVAPLMFVPYHVLDRPPQEVLRLTSAILALFALLAWMQTRPLMKLPNARIDRKTVSIMLMMTSIVLTGVVVFAAGKFDLSLEDVYERRFSAREIVQPRTLLAYAIILLSSSLSPILVSLGYVRKRWDLLLFGILGAMSVFSLSGAKTNFFMPMFLFALLLLTAGNRRTFAQKMVVGACCLVVASILEFTQLDSYTLSTYFVRRQLFIPSLLTSYYWDFFSDNPHVYYTDSFMRYFIPPQYDLSIASLIGETRFHSYETNANANFWAASFANLGYLGMVLTTLALGMLLRIIDSIARNGEFLVSSLVVGMFAINWSNGALETSMLSNGVAFSLVILYFLRIPPGAKLADRSAADPSTRSRRNVRRRRPHSRLGNRAISSASSGNSVRVDMPVKRGR